MAGRVFSERKSGPRSLASVAPVLLISGLAFPQLILGVAGRDETLMKVAAGVMLASFLGSAGVFLVACVWSELRAWTERRA
jgi:hypothetical protein